MKHLKSPFIGPGLIYPLGDVWDMPDPQVWFLGILQLIVFVSIFVGNIRKSVFKWMEEIWQTACYLWESFGHDIDGRLCQLLIRPGFIYWLMNRPKSNKPRLSPYHVGPISTWRIVVVLIWGCWKVSLNPLLHDLPCWHDHFGICLGYTAPFSSTPIDAYV